MKTLQTDVAIIGAGTAGMTALRSALAHTDRELSIQHGPFGTTCARAPLKKIDGGNGSIAILVHRIVNRLIAACVAKDPEDRFQTSRDLKRAHEWTARGVETPTVTGAASRSWIVWAAAAAL